MKKKLQYILHDESRHYEMFERCRKKSISNRKKYE